MTKIPLPVIVLLSVLCLQLAGMLITGAMFAVRCHYQVWAEYNRLVETIREHHDWVACDAYNKRATNENDRHLWTCMCPLGWPSEWRRCVRWLLGKEYE